MASKQVTVRQKSADSVIAAGGAHAEPIQAALAEMTKPLLKKGEAIPDYAALVTTSCALLAAARDRMLQADTAHEAELRDDPPAREARNTAQTALRDELVTLREIMIGVYGAPTAAKLFAGPTPEDPVVLSRFAGEVADNFEKTKLPTPRIKGAKLHTGATVESLRSRRAELDKHLEAVQREMREAQKTLDAKTAAMAAYDKVFAGVATTLSGLLRLAGKAELAVKVRPSSRRPGQTAGDVGEEVAGEGPAEK